jgi:RNA polymerase sigma factor (sigma-70 family)
MECVLRHIRKLVRSPEAATLSDAQLVERFAADRDEAAFELLLHRHGAMVLGVCRRVLQHTHDVEDAFQATFLLLARKAGSIRKRASVASWLYGVAYRIALKARGGATRRRLREMQTARLPQADLLAEVAWRELRALIDEELSRLPEKCRVSFILCCLEGKTHQQAARELGWPAGSMSRWLARGRELLRARLAGRGIVLSSAALLAALAAQVARASVPPLLLDTTARVALAADKALTAGAISCQAAALADDAARAMRTAPWTVAARAILAVILLGLGVGLVVVGPARNRPLPAKVGALREPASQNAEKPKAPAPGPSPKQIKEMLLHRFGGNAQSEAAVAAGLRWLADHQAKDGHWALDSFPKNGACKCKDHSGYRNDIAGTAFGLLPLLGAGYTHKAANDNPYSKHVRNGLTFLTHKLNRKTGDFGGGMYAHGLATMALCEAYALTRDPVLKPAAQAAVDYIVKAQHQAGGWRYAPGQAGDTSVLGWQVQALQTAQASDLVVPAATLQRVGSYLDACESATDHGYSYIAGGSSTPAMTAAGLMCRQYLQGWGARQPRLRMGVFTNLMSHLPGTEKNMYYAFYATKTMYLVGGDDWKKWNEKMRDLLVREQDEGKIIAHQKGSWSPQGDPFAQAGGRLMATCLSLLNLEVYYRSDLLLAAGPQRRLKAEDLESLWRVLGEQNNLKARQGVWALARSPGEAVPFLKKQVPPAPPPKEARRIAELIADLDSNRFAVRKKAVAELEKLGEAAEAALRIAARGKSVEVVRRATEILEKLEQKTAAQRLRLERALDALELMGTVEARDVLKGLARGQKGAWLTQEAELVLKRMTDRTGGNR